MNSKSRRDLLEAEKMWMQYLGNRLTGEVELVIFKVIEIAGVFLRASSLDSLRR